MTEVMNAHVVETGARAQALPLPVDVPLTGGSRLPADDHPWVAWNAGNVREHSRYGGGQWNHARTGLGIAQPQLPRRPVHVIPTQRQDFRSAAAGQHQESERRHRLRPGGAISFGLVQNPAQPLDLFPRQEPLGLACLVARHGFVPLDRRPQASANRNILARITITSFAELGLSRSS